MNKDSRASSQAPGGVGQAARSSRFELARVAACVVAAASLALLCACAPLKAYRVDVPVRGEPTRCFTDSGSQDAQPKPEHCVAAATERDAHYDLHVVEFDDEGRPFAQASSQVDSAVDQIHALLRDTPGGACVKLFVYIHGWRHTAEYGDNDVVNFRSLLRDFADGADARAAARKDPCGEPAPDGLVRTGPTAPSRPGQARRVVGVYVGWRGLPVQRVEPLATLSFWDRKNTAERVAQGSVRELFARLSQLAAYAPAAGRPIAQPPATSSQLRTYVIGHSFGADVAFRALSQSMIDSFADGLDNDQADGLASVPRFVDTLILVNPAIEAARFDPLFRVAEKRSAHCAALASAALCEQPKYQGPVVAILQSEGDVATKTFFPIAASLSTAFETPVDAEEGLSIRQTIGWDDRYLTHRLSVAKCGDDDKRNAFETDAAGVPRYRPAGWSRCFDTFLQVHLGGASAAAGAQVVYNGPLWNARVAKEIIKNHTETWNPTFHALLVDLIDEEQTHPYKLILPAGSFPGVQ